MNLLNALLERTYILFKSDYCSIWLSRLKKLQPPWDVQVRNKRWPLFSRFNDRLRQTDVNTPVRLPRRWSVTSYVTGLPDEEDGSPAAEETVPCLICLQPNYMATNELPIMRIYCLVLSQELIKSTQLKAAMRKTLAVNRAFIQLIHDCQLK